MFFFVHCIKIHIKDCLFKVFIVNIISMNRKNHDFRRVPVSMKRVLFAFVFLSAWSSSDLSAETLNLADAMVVEQSMQSDKIAVQGVVKDQSGEPLIGVGVKVKGTTMGTVTDFDGKFNLSVPSTSSVLEFSYIGYATQDVKVGSNTSFNVVMKDNAKAMDEVVVTALGIKRQKRSLGYSTTDVKGDEFTEARDINIGNALSGKVAGVSVGNNATGVGGSSRVVIRGNSSISGNNQPLYVIDGVPFDNSNQGNAGQWGGMDLGDGLASVSPDDIADIQVLKGAAASALYGYRGGNGAILITTKSGKKGKPISIELNNNLTFNTIYDYRDYQKVYGLGTQGAAPSDEISARSTPSSSWGARMEGQDAVNFLGNPYKYSYVDNWDNFYRTGITNSTSLSFSGASENVTYRFGISNLADRGILPNSSLSQQGINMNTTYDITKKLHLTVTANYTFDKSKGRSGLSDGNGNTNATLLYLGNSFDVRWLERGAPGAQWGSTASGAELTAGNNKYFNNPYWLQYRKTNDLNRNRLTAGATLRYDIFDWLYAQGAVTRDGYNLEFKQVQPVGAAADPEGFITEYTKNYSEMNLNYLLGFNREFGDWSVGATFGGNAMRNISKEWGVNGAKPFLINGIESPNNTGNRPMTKKYAEYRVNSIYGTADIGYKNQLFLNLTGRNDWFSTLSKSNNHYFYPSVTTSWVFTDTFSEKPDWLSFGKVRLGYASASNGTDPYRNALYYEFNDYKVNSQSVANVKGDIAPNADLKPVKISEWETGLNLSLFENRLNLDLALYYKKTKDDILKVGISNSSGYNYKIMNLGEIRNKGIEIMLSGVPVQTRDFTWNSSFNLAINDNKVLELGGAESLVLDGGYARSGDVSIQVVKDKSYGQIYGYKYQRDDQGKVVFKDGIAQRSAEKEYLGSGVYKTTGGWRNDFSYKNWTFAFLLDFKLGAKIFSGTNMGLYSSGLHKNTLQGRESDPTKDKIVGNGVMLNSEGKYVPNTVGVSAQDYWTGIVSNSIAEEFVYNASFLKLREVSLGYTLPKSIFANQNVVKSITLSLVARNLWTIVKHTDNIDPESAYNNSNAQGLELNGYPATRSFGFNVNVKF